MHKIMFVCLSLLISLPSLAEGNQELLEKLAVAKMTGLCGAVQQMARFQSTTQLKNGEEFIDKFVDAEAARLGIHRAQFLKGCELASRKYDKYLSELDNE